MKYMRLSLTVIYLLSSLCFGEMRIDELERLSKSGNADALVKLGFMYIEGKEVPKDLQKGEELILEAAKSGNSDAQVTLGSLYALGMAKTQDNVKS